MHSGNIANDESAKPSNANGLNSQYHNTFQITLNWKLSLFTVLFLPLFISLGIWQLNRAEEKQTLIEAFEAQQLLPAMSITDYLASYQESAYRQIALTGVFDSQRYWLLDNQVDQGRVGYRVLVPLYINHDGIKKAVLVDWQWLPAPPQRELLPSASFPEGKIPITGFLMTPADNPLLSYMRESEGWPQRIAEVDLDAMSKQLGTALLPGVLNRQQYQLPMNTTPVKHRGYAWQWFAMALALIVASVLASTNIITLFRKTPNNTDTESESL